jgi:transposase/ADP-ribose pyrophosphatase YjhB (NUDIX family)
MKKAAVKVKAMGLFVSDGRLLVSPGFDPVSQKPHLRLLGGQVEFGERSEETLVREMREELGADVEVGELLEVVQNVYVLRGRQKHEIAFIHRARFLDDAFLGKNELPNIEPGSDEVAKWLPIAEVLNGPVPLFPPTHQHAANGQKNLRSRCMGRSRGGLTTKVHVLVDAEGLPIALKLTEGQAHDGRSAADMLDTVQAGHTLLADRAYDSDALREMLCKRGAGGNIKPMRGRNRKLPFSGWVYRQRNAVERFFNKIKHFRAVATRYDKRDDNFLASVKLASLRIWLRTYESVT